MFPPVSEERKGAYAMRAAIEALDVDAVAGALPHLDAYRRVFTVGPLAAATRRYIGRAPGADDEVDAAARFAQIARLVWRSGAAAPTHYDDVTAALVAAAWWASPLAVRVLVECGGCVADALRYVDGVDLGVLSRSLAGAAACGAPVCGGYAEALRRTRLARATLAAAAGT
jgi:hypothetical protein